jgi:hypothetical protein
MLREGAWKELMEGGAGVRKDCRALTIEDRRRTGSKSMGSWIQGFLIWKPAQMVGPESGIAW